MANTLLESEVNAYVASHWRDIGVAQRKLTVLEQPEPLTAVLEASRPLTKLSRGQRATIARACDPLRWAPKPEPLARGSSFCPDDHTLSVRVAQARFIAEQAELITAEDEREFESADANKLTLQKGYAHMWYVPTEPFINSRPSKMAEAIELMVDRYGDADPPPKVNAVRRNTNHGGFDQDTSDTSLLLHAMMSSYAGSGPDAWARMEDIYAEVASIYGADEHIMSTGFTRKGAIRKEQAIRMMRGGLATKVGMYVGYAPRARNVWGVVAACNITLRQGYDCLASIVRNSGNWHGREDELSASFDAAWARGLTIANDDISSYDTNVSRGDQEALASACTKKWPHLDWLWRFWLNVERCPLMLGPMVTGEAARLHDKLGQTTSGGLWTSLAGTILNQARSFTILHRATRIPIRTLMDMRDRGEILVMCWGDDTVIALKEIPDDWAEISQDIGFPSKILPGAAFLKKLYRPGRWQASASRVFQQTVWNEHGGRTPAIELLGLVARCASVETAALWPVVERTIFGYPNETLREMNISSLADARRMVTTPFFLSRLGADLKANPFVLQNRIAMDKVSTEAAKILAIAGAAIGRPPERDDIDVTKLGQVKKSDIIEVATALTSEAPSGLPNKWTRTLEVMKGET